MPDAGRPATRPPGLDVREAAARLAVAGVASPDHDARALAAHVLGVEPARLGLVAPSAAQAAAFAALVARRAGREPLQHLTGLAWFRHLRLAVGPGVFVPRPETEGLVELVLPACGPGVSVADLCAGSGAVGLAVADETGAAVTCVEASAQAAVWLRRNVIATGLPVTVVEADAVGWRPVGPVDVVVANPPYLPAGLELEPEVAGHDPAAALWGGPDGLAVIRALIPAARAQLRPGGLLALEHDAGHQPAVLALLTAAGFVDVAGHFDLTGRPRYATARTPG